MRIKLSKTQWNEIGKKAGWIKKAQIEPNEPNKPNKPNKIVLDIFAAAYVEAALVTSQDNDDVPLDEKYTIDDIDAQTLQKMVDDCTDFQTKAGSLLNELNDKQSGYDFWLTRNGHGAGFWDRDLGDVGDKLTELCDSFGGYDLYVGDGGKIYGSGG